MSHRGTRRTRTSTRKIDPLNCRAVCDVVEPPQLSADLNTAPAQLLADASASRERLPPIS